MKRESTLPPVFAQYQSHVQYVQKVGHSKWTSSCPACLGSVHSDGEWPDRCVWFLDEKPLGACMRCGKLFWPDAAPDWKPPTPAELEQWRQKRETEQAARLRSAERALAHLRDTKLWEKYAEMAGDRGRTWWEGRGIPYPFQVLWNFGWDHDLSRWGCASATIPLFDQAGECVNIKHRLEDDSKGRYRYNINGEAPLWLADPDISLENHIIACEGEIKAAVGYVTLDDPAACIVGLPGLNPSQSIIDTLSQAERVTLILDPDSDTPGDDGWSRAGRLVKAIGRRSTSLLIPPGKVDDALLAAKADRWDMRRLVGQAELL